jgi:hypothetical protein
MAAPVARTKSAAGKASKRKASSTRGPSKKRLKREQLEKDSRLMVGRGVAKYFDEPETSSRKLFYGTIVNYKVLSGIGTERRNGFKGNVLWDITYDDGDEEEMDAREIDYAMKLYQENIAKDMNADKRRSS